MRQYRAILLLLFLLLGFTSCSPGHLGSNIIAFIRDGHLWTIDPDGANAYAIVSESTPVVGYSWSPTHQLLAFRLLDTDFAKTATAKHIAINPLTGAARDLPSTENTIGVDGGSAIPIMFSSPDILYSTPMWNTSGTRLLYRQIAKTAPANSNNAIWWLSQNDQPGGIAAKALPTSYSIVSLSSSNNSLYSNTAIGNSNDGVFTVPFGETKPHSLTSETLPGHPLPAPLERVLWQPGHQQPAILYAIDTSPKEAANGSPLKVQLMIRTTDNHITPLTTCSCTQFAWSPDGNSVLYRTDSTYTILHLAMHTSFNITDEQASVPYWSPDSQFLLLDGLHQITLIRVRDGQQTTLLSDGQTGTASEAASLSSTSINALLQPVSNSIWAADSRHFLFLTHNRLLWQDHALPAGKGLYTVTIDNQGQVQGKPTLVDTGNDTQAGWSYEDPNISFLYN